MNPIKEIKSPVQEEMRLFESKFKDSLSSKVPLLDKVLHYIVKRKGKQMRPMFVFLSNKLFGEITESTFRAASLIELLHTATLVHDDVIDDANIRRGFFSINALWKNKIAVLVGDYLLSRGLLLSLENEEYNLLQIVSKAVKEMSEGELLQIEKARRLDIEEDVYFEIIRQKTATLIAACCACGATAADQSPEIIEKMRVIIKNMKDYILSSGLYLGLLQILLLVFSYVMGVEFSLNEAWSLINAFLPYILLVYLVIRYKKLVGGYVSFKETFSVTLGTLVAGAFIGTFFSILMYNFIAPDFAAMLKQATLDKLFVQMEQLPEDNAMYGVMETLIEQTEAEDIYSPSNQLKAFFYGLLVQIIFSLIIAAFVKKDKPIEISE